MRAKFIGTDGSLGYRYGQIYELEQQVNVAWADLHNLHVGVSPLVVRRKGGSGFCPYSSEQAFRANWEVLNG